MQKYKVTSTIEIHEAFTSAKIDFLAIAECAENKTQAIRGLCIPTERQISTLLNSIISVNEYTLIEDAYDQRVDVIKLKRLNYDPLAYSAKLTIDNLVEID